MSIHGTDIRDAALAIGVPATGTTIRIFGSGSTKTVLEANTEVRPDAGPNQVVRFTVPDRSGTPWTTTEMVSLELEFMSVTSAPVNFQYDD